MEATVKETQCQQILGYLSRGGKLTPLEALRLFGCNRLAARVNDLRREGFSIRTNIIPVDTSSGEMAHVAEYSMGQWW
jgi:hypothetical protein